MLIVGLGNPGLSYLGSRHNYGAEAVRLLGKRNDQKFRPDKRVLAETASVRDGTKMIVLAVPQTYMNDSGLSVQALWRRYLEPDASTDQLVVVHDELDLAPGTVKIKSGGGTAGHNGLRSIESHLHHRNFVRVRIGIGKPPSPEAGVDYVLRRPGKHDRELLATAIEIAADAVESIFSEGLARALNRFNTRP